MAFEPPSSLIRELQIALRKEAGVSDYDPDDPTLSDLPSVEQTISELDPSPPYLRCQQCQGPLLRGLQSMVCVYCGAKQRREFPPDSIHFRSTLGYRLLLESLDLDGSEPVEGNDSIKGKNRSKDRLVLSDLFDFELKWSSEPKTDESNISDKSPHRSKISLNLAGVDLDNFFSGPKKEISENALIEPEIHSREMRSTEGHTFPGTETINLFENPQSPDVARRSTEPAVDLFSGWEDEFQSARSRTLPVDPKPIDQFPLSSPTGVSSPGEVAVVPETEFNFDFNRMENDAKLKDDSNSMPPMKDNWNHDDLWPTGSTKTPQNEKINDDEDAFDDWQGFTSSGKAPEPLSSSWNNTSTTSASTNAQASEMNPVNYGDNVQDMDLGSFMQPDPFSGAPSHHNSSADAKSAQEAFTSDRVVDVEAEEDAKSKATANDSSDAVMGSEFADSTVETLMSQIPDLSFMLESNLSIPKKEKEDNSDSVS